MFMCGGEQELVLQVDFDFILYLITKKATSLIFFINLDLIFSNSFLQIIIGIPPKPTSEYVKADSFMQPQIVDDLVGEEIIDLDIG